MTEVASVLSKLATKHPYYCSNDAGASWETMTDFLDGMESADIDMNLVFRWDIRPRDEDNPGRYYAEVFIIHQRKGIFSPHQIERVSEDEAIRFHAYLEKHWAVLKTMWEPLSSNQKEQSPPIDQ